eukprot:TRINITY_DN6813_c0_g1_i2.p1 TRINITY_DN6813_c0_g1~~TRINITY_DN6813_c0_g1_i2.p1  ORF type:complete len:209 (-),score=23.39 TRINITY_DN6813_c0_g1_i2:41-667(-)
MHTKGVIHRDIKPENLVIDKFGYVRVTDMGIARLISPNNASDTSGTPGYMAPEVICKQNHGVAVDYFALGVIAYEFMLGFRPYRGKNRHEIKQKIVTKQVQLKKSDLSEGWSVEAADFINKCLQTKPVNRLGVNGPNEVKQHVWLKDFDWDLLFNKKIKSPFNIDLGEKNYESRDSVEDDFANTEEKADLKKQTQIGIYSKRICWILF